MKLKHQFTIIDNWRKLVVAAALVGAISVHSVDVQATDTPTQNAA